MILILWIRKPHFLLIDAYKPFIDYCIIEYDCDEFPRTAIQKE